MNQLSAIGSVFLIGCEVSARELVKRLFSLYLPESDVKVDDIPTTLRKNQTRILKLQNV